MVNDLIDGMLWETEVEQCWNALKTVARNPIKNAIFFLFKIDQYILKNLLEMT